LTNPSSEDATFVTKPKNEGMLFLALTFEERLLVNFLVESACSDIEFDRIVCDESALVVPGKNRASNEAIAATKARTRVWIREPKNNFEKEKD
jgi:hypothetical protein